MAVLGNGKAHGACSLLHAAGLGYGASVALDLPVAVRLLDAASKRTLEDPDGLLKCVLAAWSNAGHPFPQDRSAEEFHWAVASKIPPRQGLKSSAAIADVRSLTGPAQLCKKVSNAVMVLSLAFCRTLSWCSRVKS